MPLINYGGKKCKIYTIGFCCEICDGLAQEPNSNPNVNPVLTRMVNAIAKLEQENEGPHSKESAEYENLYTGKEFFDGIGAKRLDKYLAILSTMLGMELCNIGHGTVKVCGGRIPRMTEKKRTRMDARSLGISGWTWARGMN